MHCAPARRVPSDDCVMRCFNGPAPATSLQSARNPSTDGFVRQRWLPDIQPRLIWLTNNKELF